MRKSAILIFICFIIIMTFSISSAQEKYIIIDVEGEGQNRNSAIESAWLNGIHQAAGSFIDAKTELNNDQLTERIIAYSRGMVEKYEVLAVDDTQAKQGIYQVKVRLWIVKELLRDGTNHAVSNSAEISFSPDDIKNIIEELDAKEIESKNASKITSQSKSKTAAELLSAMLERYKPEDFLQCYIPGKPEPEKNKPDAFILRVQVNFNDKLYKENFIPDLIQVLDQICYEKKNSILSKYKTDLRNIFSKKNNSAKNGSVILGAFENQNNYSLAVYNKPERFGVRLYSFKNDDVDKINGVLSNFMKRIKKISGVMLELIDEDKETMDIIEHKFNVNFLLSSQNDKFLIHPTIVDSSTENTQLIIPISLDLPEEVLPYVKHLKASLMITQTKPADLGVKLNNSLQIQSVNYTSVFVDGLRVNDTITHINDEYVRKIQDVENIINALNAGDTVKIRLIRNATAYIFYVTLKEKQ